MNKPDPKDNPWRAAALTSAIGIDLVVCLLAGYWFGEWLSHTLGGQFWLLGGFLLGLGAAVGSIYLMIKQYGGL
ncbi:AtpZ/AtpI family protein [Paenibacillus hexagrammi]|uniref:AtpZ/AtpI family protein n=1 Tax=Paenibacillus hexagrammi TaxID=2908839 RepID=A0ABY3SH17_9BACL|nr:AtpZ/AtpI family protein [Paenibacillus sp. YPD9-1]UJF33284.1 AtpZ/AtpI family protein [Paenibacillus sp. YPD9-1]